MASEYSSYTPCRVPTRTPLTEYLANAAAGLEDLDPYDLRDAAAKSTTEYDAIRRLEPLRLAPPQRQTLAADLRFADLCSAALKNNTQSRGGGDTTDTDTDTDTDTNDEQPWARSPSAAMNRARLEVELMRANAARPYAAAELDTSLRLKDRLGDGTALAPSCGSEGTAPLRQRWAARRGLREAWGRFFGAAFAADRQRAELQALYDQKRRAYDALGAPGYSESVRRTVEEETQRARDEKRRLAAAKSRERRRERERQQREEDDRICRERQQKQEKRQCVRG